jgi:NADH-quinone oxidoreductase subunit L
MFPLHIWLPNAMEGPTPVSALIHAATMVVAGVYLVARLFPLFVLDAAAMNVVTVVGIFSALFAALIACTQTDIKRVLAYSTMSQIGYMMFSLGISSSEVGSHSGFTASLFHLFTHAFFKSLLFLGAGMVIHFIHSNEMKHMGGLRKFLPVTHFTFLIACLAIAGIPPLAGFFSKEEILHAAHETYLPLYWVALLTSGITAFYMFRLYFSVFWNKKTELHHESGGEAPAVMKVPLILLALCTLAVGFIPFSKYVTASGAAQHHSFDPLFAVLPVFISFAGIAFAYFLYQKQNHRAEKISLALGGFYRSALHKFYVDEIFLFITRKIIFNLVAKPAAWIDRHVVDGTVNGIAYTTEKIAVAVKGIQSGKVQSYALYFFGGIVLLAIVFIYLIK